MNWKSLLALPLLLGAACGTISNLTSATPKQAEYNAPAHETNAAVVTLSASPEGITITPLASGGENYFDAKIDYIGTMQFSADAANDGNYNVTLKEDANNLNYSGDPLKWEVGIDPSIPLTLDVHSSSGTLTFNLQDYTLNKFSADTSSGGIDAQLPRTDVEYEAAVTSSSGAVALNAADNSQINFTAISTSSGGISLDAGSDSIISAAVDTSSGVVTLTSGEGTKLNATINSSSGRINLNPALNSDVHYMITTSSGAITADVPDGAAVHLEIVQNSSGGVNVPDWLPRISGEDKTGVWETAGFDQAERKIIIVVTRTSSGAVTVQ